MDPLTHPEVVTHTVCLVHNAGRPRIHPPRERNEWHYHLGGVRHCRVPLNPELKEVLEVHVHVHVHVYTKYNVHVHVYNACTLYMHTFYGAMSLNTIELSNKAVMYAYRKRQIRTQDQGGGCGVTFEPRGPTGKIVCIHCTLHRKRFHPRSSCTCMSLLATSKVEGMCII